MSECNCPRSDCKQHGKERARLIREWMQPHPPLAPKNATQPGDGRLMLPIGHEGP